MAASPESLKRRLIDCHKVKLNKEGDKFVCTATGLEAAERYPVILPDKKGRPREYGAFYNWPVARSALHFYQQEQSLPLLLAAAQQQSIPRVAFGDLKNDLDRLEQVKAWKHVPGTMTAGDYKKTRRKRKKKKKAGDVSVTKSAGK